MPSQNPKIKLYFEYAQSKSKGLPDLRTLKEILINLRMAAQAMALSRSQNVRTGGLCFQATKAAIYSILRNTSSPLLEMLALLVHCPDSRNGRQMQPADGSQLRPTDGLDFVFHDLEKGINRLLDAPVGGVRAVALYLPDFKQVFGTAR
jgi:hypothetical protein